jgi:predicted nuclease with TOPRIM domain
MYNINKYTIKDIIKQELELLNDENFQNYWGSEIQIKNENNILNFTKVEMKDREDIVEWYERLLKKY